MKPEELDQGIDHKISNVKKLYMINNTWFIVLTLLGIFLSIALTVLASSDVLKSNALKYAKIDPEIVKIVAQFIGALSVGIQSVLATFRIRDKARGYSNLRGELEALKLDRGMSTVKIDDILMKFKEIEVKYSSIEYEKN